MGDLQMESVRTFAFYLILERRLALIVYTDDDDMSENIAQPVQRAIQDLVAPEVHELKTLVTNLQSQLTQAESRLKRQVDQRFDAQDKRAEAQNQKADAQSMALVSVLVSSPASERVAS